MTAPHLEPEQPPRKGSDGPESARDPQPGTVRGLRGLNGPQAGAQSLTRRRGICQVCGREFDVRVDGLIRHHLKPRPSHAWYRHPRCTGAEQPALPDTPAGDDHA